MIRCLNLDMGDVLRFQAGDGGAIDHLVFTDGEFYPDPGEQQDQNDQHEVDQHAFGHGSNPSASAANQPDADAAGE